jgi:hypothetical protein
LVRLFARIVIDHILLAKLYVFGRLSYFLHCVWICGKIARWKENEERTTFYRLVALQKGKEIKF